MLLTGTSTRLRSLNESPLFGSSQLAEGTLEEPRLRNHCHKQLLLIALSRVLSVIFFASSVLENSIAFKLKKERGIHALNEKARQWKL